jgi:IS5 family transposase
MYKFFGINLGVEASRHEAMICKFNHRIDESRSGKQIFASADEQLEAHEIGMSNGKIVNAAIITAPSSTKNNDKELGSGMYQTKKGDH